MKKKFVSAAIAAVMALSLAGCGSSSAASSSASQAADSTAASSTASSVTASASTGSESDVDYIKNKGTLIVGITNFAPMDYKEEGSDEWVGFDADLARKVGEDLGVDVQFAEIDWDSKILELDNKSVDVLWNGMTLTAEVTSSMECTKPYLNNAQVVVLPSDKADQYQTEDSLKDLTFAVESGSAGEAAAKEKGLNYNSVESQANALLEVKSGSSDACIIDLLMAGAMIGEGTDFANMTHTVELTTEEYGIGCRKGSDLAAYINDELAKFEDDGSLETIAEKYGVQDALVSVK